MLAAGWRWLVRAYLVIGTLWVAGAWGLAIQAAARHDVRVTTAGDLITGQSAPWWGALPAIFFGAVGVIVALQQPRNPIGWMSLAFAVCFIGSVDAQYYATAAHRLGLAPRVPAVVFLLPLWLPALALLPLMVLLFPDGRPPSARWRPAIWAYAVLCGFFLAGERQQLKWLSAGGVVSIVGVVLSSAGLLPDGGGFGFGLVAIPVGLGIGIQRYRLYDIDRIISRTLAYAIVTGLLVGVYAGLVLLTTEALPVRLSGSVSATGSTLVAAALFALFRRRDQHAVDRRFNRARYDADQTLTNFGAPNGSGRDGGSP